MMGLGRAKRGCSQHEVTTPHLNDKVQMPNTENNKWLMCFSDFIFTSVCVCGRASVHVRMRLCERERKGLVCV